MMTSKRNAWALFAAALSVSARAAELPEYCVPDAGGGFPTVPALERGEGPAFSWAQGGGCVGRPIREVWAVLHNQPLMVWQQVTQSTATSRMDIPPGMTHFYEIFYRVDIPDLDIRWTMNWIHGVPEGTMLEPKRVSVRFENVAPTSFISHWDGYIRLTEVQPRITGFAMRHQIKAVSIEAKETGILLKDVYKKLRTGGPNWVPIGGP